MTVARQPLRRPLGDDFSALIAGSRSHVDNVIGGQNRFRVMFDDDHAIALIAQLFEQREQPRVVDLMQSDARFVENIEHSRQTRADLGGEPDSLCFAARKTERRTIEAQVTEPNLEQKTKAVGDLPQSSLADPLAPLVQIERREIRERLIDRQRSDIGNTLAAELDGEAFFFQSRATALSAEPGVGLLLVTSRPSMLFRANSQSGASRAGPLRSVEGKKRRGNLGKRKSAVNAGEFLTEDQFL